jgi:hypothetical protein
MFSGLKQQDIMKLPKYINNCYVGSDCGVIINKFQNYILKKYCDNKNKARQEDAFIEALFYVEENDDMCYSKETGLGMNTNYLSIQMQDPRNSSFFIMDKERKVPHTIICYNYLKPENLLYISAFCVNQIEKGSRGYITLDIVKKACKYAGIKNILLESVPGAIEFYRKQGFASVGSLDEDELLKMKLNRSLSPLRKEQKMNSIISLDKLFNSPKKETSLERPRLAQKIRERWGLTPRHTPRPTRRASLRSSSTTKTTHGGSNKTRKSKSLPLPSSSAYSTPKNNAEIFENEDYTPIENEKMKKFISNIHDKKNHVPKNNQHRTLIDLSNDKEYVVFHNELFVNK